MKHKCIDCEGFAYWDGDWCCVSLMKILSGIDENNKTINPEVCEEEHECEDFRDASETHTPRGLELRKEEWEYFKKGKSNDNKK